MMGTPISPEPYDGPGLDYQGSALPDVRYSPANKDGMQVGRIPSVYACPYFTLTDQIPQQYSTTTICNTQLGTSTSLTLVTTCPGGAAVNTVQSRQCTAVVPLVPFVAGGGFPNQGSAVSVLAIDFGFTVGTTTAGSKTVASIPDVTQLYPGQWIVIGGAGNSTNTASLVTQVQTITPATTPSGSITVSPVPTGSLAAAPIGSANAYGAFPAQITATAVNPYFAAGTTSCLNPTESLARGLSYTAASGATATSITVKGYDIYGQPMTETKTLTANSTVYGTKAFKYVASATLNAADGAHNYSVGVSDLYGLHVRSDKWEYTNTFFNGGFNTANTGWTAAVQTTATATSGDVRGTIQMGTIGPISGYGATSSNGSIRFAIFMSIPLFNATYATPVNTTPMFGVTQF